MNLTPNNYSIAEIEEMLTRKDLLVNHEYQRGSKLWPTEPRSYFIDTILTGFPFPKLYFYEYLDVRSRKTKREIVDGQQRISTITDFLNDKFRLTQASSDFQGLRFSDLEEDKQAEFLSYSIPVDVIRNAEKSEILEMFRRMNAYTLPLNDAEKRHSGFQGQFKWFVNDVVREMAPLFVEYGVFTKRQIVRMADAELVAEMFLSIEEGVVSTSSKILSDLYKRHDLDFPLAGDYRGKMKRFYDYVLTNFSELRGTYMMKPYAFHSLFCAMMHNKYGIPGLEDALGFAPIGDFAVDAEKALNGLIALAFAHETKDIEGEFSEYVWGCMAGTNREPRRKARIKSICLALRGELL